MIKLNYLWESPSTTQPFINYVLLQHNQNEPYLVLDDDEIISTIDEVEGEWKPVAESLIDQATILSIGQFIESQHYRRLPAEFKKHWPGYIEEVLVMSDEAYLLVAKANIAFERFEKIFRHYIKDLIKEEWQITFKVYNADFTAGFEVTVN